MPFMKTVGLRGLVTLARRGVITLGMPNNPAAYPALPRLLRQLAARLLDQERGFR